MTALSKLGFGSAPIGNLYRTIPEDEALKTVQTALAGGMTLFDTAPLYGAGLSEQRLGAALVGIPRQNYFLESKVGRVLTDQGIQFDLTERGLEQSLEGSLKRLGTAYLDMILLHDPDEFETQAVQTALPTLVRWREQGMVSKIGVGMNQWQMPQRFLEQFELDVVMLAGRYTLLEQTALGFLNQCQQYRVQVFAAGVFNSGILATGANPNARYNYLPASQEILEKTRHLEQICQTHQVRLPDAAVQFVHKHPAVVCAVLGSSSPSETRDNLAAFKTPIPPEFWLELKENKLIDGDVPIA